MVLGHSLLLPCFVINIIHDGSPPSPFCSSEMEVEHTSFLVVMTHKFPRSLLLTSLWLDLSHVAIPHCWKNANIVLCPTNTLGTEKGRIEGERGEFLQWKVWFAHGQLRRGTSGESWTWDLWFSLGSHRHLIKGGTKQTQHLGGQMLQVICGITWKAVRLKVDYMGVAAEI